jgi:hypothetical protein
MKRADPLTRKSIIAGDYTKLYTFVKTVDACSVLRMVALGFVLTPRQTEKQTRVVILRDRLCNPS